MSFLILAEGNSGSLSEQTSKTISAVYECKCKLGSSNNIDVLCLGSDAKSLAEKVSNLNGVDGVLVKSDDCFDHMIAEDVADLILALSSNYNYFIAPATTNGKNIMPRLAALLDVMVISDVVDILEGDLFIRPIYAGNAMQTVKSEDVKKVITVRTTGFALSEKAGSSAPVKEVENSNVSSGLTTWVSNIDKSSSDRPELTSAKIVISGGRGIGSRENFSLIEKVADKLGAAVGASRAAVDLGYANNDMQVGQTGKVVAPDLYIAVGISGAIQHLAGMKDSKVIVAINKDPDAPVFQISDYGLVGDLFEILPDFEKTV